MAGRREVMATRDGGGELLYFGLLGPLAAWRGATPINVGPPQQRTVLAALLIGSGHHATTHELVDAIWGEDPPRDAVGTVRTYVSRLRKALGPDADLITGQAGGYVLRPGAGAVSDAAVAEQAVAHADSATQRGDAASTRALLREALALWDGEPLAGLPGAFAETERARLTEWRLSLLERRLALDIEAHDYADAISELTALTAAYPLRERFRELLMLSLSRSGRQAEALAVYTDSRRLLIDELGVEPGPKLADLQQRILRGGEQPVAPVATTTPRLSPAQLPARLADFTGRDAFVDELGKQLEQTSGMVMAVSSVSGIGGVGKTTLAVHVGHAVRESFPDGQLYADLQGAGASPAEPAAVLGSFLRSLGTPDAEIPEPLEERAALFRSMLAGRRVLALLDNARDAAQVRPLLPGTEGCAAVITSRARMTDLAGAHHVDLDVMAPDEALLLFTRIVGAHRVTPERDAAMDVVAACGFLPLAIRIAASRLAARRTWTVAVLARKLSDEHRRLDELRVGDLAVKATFELGYGQLEPEQARAFRLLGLIDGPDVSLSAAAAVLDRTEDDTEELLEDLVDTSLLESAAPGRYRYHDLLRLFARTCADREEPSADRDAAQSRLLDFYLATAARVYELGRPGDTLIRHLSPVTRAGLDFESREAAQNWLFSEAECLLAAVRQFAHGDSLPRTVDLLLTAKDLAESGLYSPRFVPLATAVLQAAEQSGDVRSQARAHVVLSSARQFTGRFELSYEHATDAHRLADACGDIWVTGEAANDRGVTASLLGRQEEATDCLEQALVAYREDRNLDGESCALRNLARIHGETGSTTRAIELAEQTVRLDDQAKAPLRLASSRYSLGVVLNTADRHLEALTQLDAAAMLFRENRMELWEGLAYFRIAQVHLAVRAPAESAAYAEKALSRFRGIGGDWHRGSALTVLGRALGELGQPDRAQACLSEARALRESGSTQAQQA
ncbi:BTAD domain-containing putative transcriptional regulator [Streptomyces sp. WMMC500]|uniref:AfsR/SARP family transcriptional regulator n=1 Tax=Streptomyces sp. WMMC500 TaxID=3015154 RepID=UPI00248BBC5C|nr:AfsR/SARP family transcriptional regulator [Streptomyces sp. WMMC500]WBB58677.1 BTAD domain-containing putative transcriptional regulator [Streptomyces sp. WMMC500]